MAPADLSNPYGNAWAIIPAATLGWGERAMQYYQQILPPACYFYPSLAWFGAAVAGDVFVNLYPVE
jgi:hypothetical protein